MNYEKENGKNYVSPSIQIIEVMGEEMMDITSPGGTMDGGQDEANSRIGLDVEEVTSSFENIW